jgi:hypothetical protein
MRFGEVYGPQKLPFVYMAGYNFHIGLPRLNSESLGILVTKLVIFVRFGTHFAP